VSTNNACRERLATARTFRGPWTKGQRCTLPADSFDEPNWTSGGYVWWRFWRADDEPSALAGIWSEWVDPVTAEVVPSSTMITQNCDGHPILGLMHKPDPKLPADKQDKRAVVPLEQADWDQWLTGTAAQAEALIRVPGVEVFRQGPLTRRPGPSHRSSEAHNAIQNHSMQFKVVPTHVKGVR
jgi:putative SOS response-associated peptidase YedK